MITKGFSFFDFILYIDIDTYSFQKKKNKDIYCNVGSGISTLQTKTMRKGDLITVVVWDLAFLLSTLKMIINHLHT